MVSVLSFNSRFNILVPDGNILLKPLGIISDLFPSIINPSSRSLAISTPSHLHVGILVLAT